MSSHLHFMLLSAEKLGLCFFKHQDLAFVHNARTPTIWLSLSCCCSMIHIKMWKMKCHNLFNCELFWMWYFIGYMSAYPVGQRYEFFFLSCDYDPVIFLCCVWRALLLLVLLNWWNTHFVFSHKPSFALPDNYHSLTVSVFFFSSFFSSTQQKVFPLIVTTLITKKSPLTVIGTKQWM